MSLYEHVFLARQDISAQQVEALLQSFRTILEERGGTVAKTEYWGVKSLAYRIKKNRKAHYTLMNLDAPHEAVAELERQMRLSTDVIATSGMAVMAVAIAVIAETGAIVAIAMAAADPDAITGTATASIRRAKRVGRSRLRASLPSRARRTPDEHNPSPGAPSLLSPPQDLPVLGR